MFIIERNLSSLAKPEGLVERYFNNCKPGIARCFVGEMKQNINFFQRAVGGLRIEKEDERDDDEVCGREDNVSLPAYIVEGYGGNEDNTVEPISIIFNMCWKNVRGSTNTKLKSQLALVLSALAGPRILSGTTST